MNKKLVAVGLSCIVGITMLTTVAFASFMGDSGYEAYKAAVKTTLSANSYTVNTQISVKDNGTKIVSADGIIKKDTLSGLSSEKINITSNGKTSTAESYYQDGKTINKGFDSDIYNVMTLPANLEKRHFGIQAEKLDPQAISDSEKILDALVGNLQNFVVLNKKADGTGSLSVDLNSSQIPAIANILASLGIKRMTDVSSSTVITNKEATGNGPDKLVIKDSSFGNNILGQFPKLSTDINIEKVSLKADTYTNNYIQNQIADITISGKDTSGVSHSLDINITLQLSGINATTPDKIDLTGKNVKEIQMKQFMINRGDISGKE